MTRNKSGKINLDRNAFNALYEMVTETKADQSFIKTNQSKMASAIILLFFEKYFKKESKYLTNLFFDEKAYIQNAINSSRTSEELEEMLSKILKKKRKIRRKKPTKELNEIKETSSSNTEFSDV